MISGSLASSKPPDGGKQEEHGDEETETQSRGSLQGSGSRSNGERRQDAGGIGRAISRPSHSDHRMGPEKRGHSPFLIASRARKAVFRLSLACVISLLATAAQERDDVTS